MLLIFDKGKRKAAEPLIAIFFMNSWEPFRSHKEAIKSGLEEIKKLGFNCFILDSKPCEDFFMRMEGKGTSSYVGMQEYICKIGNEIELNHICLSAWFFGDNWFDMGVREYEIRYGDVIQDPPCLRDNLKQKKYKMWSPKTQEIMVNHQQNLYTLFMEEYGKTVSSEKTCPIFISYADPSVKPSFDEEGQRRYRYWLAKRYSDIGKFNNIYQTSYIKFDDIKPEDYWAYYKDCKQDTDWHHWHPTLKDFEQNELLIRRWVDNQLWRKDELTLFFKSIKRLYQEKNTGHYLMPSLFQWKFFFNDSCMKWWWSTLRAVDPWEIKSYVDQVSFITLPADCYSRADCYVVSAELSMLRAINGYKDFTCGLYFGRYILEDIYRYISPAEILGTALAHGVTSFFSYCYNGLDDGGTLFKMPKEVKDSLRDSIRWFKTCVPYITGKARKREIAILFPMAMSLLEPPIERTPFPDHRMDVLGWFKYIVDGYYMVDFIYPNQIKEGYLDDYSVLVLSCDNMYRFMPDKEMEKYIENWVRDGGIVIHGPQNESLPDNLRPIEYKYKQESMIYYKENINPESINYAYYEDIEPLACFKSGKIAIGVKRYGKGQIYSLGFNIGYAYNKQSMEPVSHGVEDSYPIYMTRRNPIYDIFADIISPRAGGTEHLFRGIEVGDFGNVMIFVNHNPIPFKFNFSNLKIKDAIFQYPAGDYLLPHTAVLVIKNNFVKDKDKDNDST